MTVTYYVALPFVDSEDGPQPGPAIECTTASEARSKAESMSRKDEHVGAVAFSRAGDPAIGEFSDAELLGRYGLTPDDFAAL